MTDETTDAVPDVYAAMAAASKAITAVGKSLKNEQAGYSARSIDDVLDAVHGPLADAGVVLVPRVIDRRTEVRQSRANRPLYYVELEVSFTFYGPDGTSVEVLTWGEAMDAQDKATNKAMTAALKTCLIQTFTIPVAGDDADRHDPMDDAPAEPMATREQVQELGEQLGTIWARLGRTAYPRAWQASLPSLPFMRERGATVAQYEAGVRILSAAIAELEAQNESMTEDEAEAAREIPPAADVCPECGHLAEGPHAGGCSHEPF